MALDTLNVLRTIHAGLRRNVHNPIALSMTLGGDALGLRFTARAPTGAGTCLGAGSLLDNAPCAKATGVAGFGGSDLGLGSSLFGLCLGDGIVRNRDERNDGFVVTCSNGRKGYVHRLPGVIRKIGYDRRLVCREHTELGSIDKAKRVVVAGQGLAIMTAGSRKPRNAAVNREDKACSTAAVNSQPTADGHGAVIQNGYALLNSVNDRRTAGKVVAAHAGEVGRTVRAHAVDVINGAPELDGILNGLGFGFIRLSCSFLGLGIHLGYVFLTVNMEFVNANESVKRAGRIGNIQTEILPHSRFLQLGRKDIRIRGIRRHNRDPLAVLILHLQSVFG